MGEAALEATEAGVGEAGEEAVGFGEGEDVVVDGVVAVVPFDEEAFFAGLGMGGEGAVGEAEF